MPSRTTAVLILCLLAAWQRPAGATPPLRFELRGSQVVGQPLYWSDQRAIVMGRTGRIWEFPPAEGSGYVKLRSSFAPYSFREMRDVLKREFGRQFEVSGTGHYLVVHPAGQRDRWAGRFEQMYRSFDHYFSVRGLKSSSPRFPLVAIAFARQEDFVRYAASQGVRVAPGVMGYYSPGSNRILLFDVDARGANDAAWYTNAETIIHEATHQMAFNTGLHSRLALPPVWVAEGLATMFEAPGVWNAGQFRNRSDRINRRQLAVFRTHVGGGRPRDGRSGPIESLIESDRPFREAPAAAYARAWALSFYLTETQPQKYARYLAVIGGKANFANDSPARRRSDFTEVFGTDFGMLWTRQLRFLEQLPSGD